MRATKNIEFRNGVHPPESKGLTAGLPIRRLPFPAEVIIPLGQHIGAPAKAIVRPGDRVERGDKVAEAQGFVSVPHHASATGTVAEISRFPHPNGTYSQAIRIEVDPYSAQQARARSIVDWETLSVDEIVATVQDAGVVGLGGAAFPTHVKLRPPEGESVDCLIVNGCECEPYLTTDHRVMVEYPDRVRNGIRIMLRCLGARRAIVGIEKNKPDAIKALEDATRDDDDIEIVALRVRYPQGAEKMLLKALIDREVPIGKLPVHIGAVVQNVGSIATIAEAFETGLPLLERVVTVTGTGVAEPANLLVPIGTRLRVLIEACGGLTDGASEVILGGPMMGTSVGDLDAPVLKGTTGVLVLSQRETQARRTYPCIRCGHCLDACPVFLNPQALGSLAKSLRYDEMGEDHNLATCMLCGCCSYVCPSNIPLSQMFQVSKQALAKAKATQR